MVSAVQAAGRLGEETKLAVTSATNSSAFPISSKHKGKVGRRTKVWDTEKNPRDYPKLFGMGDRLARSHSLYDPNYYPIH